MSLIRPKSILPVVSFFFFLHSFGQNNICDCCSYTSLQYKNDYVEIFSPEIISKNNIRELTIYATSKKSRGKDTTFSIVDHEYKEMIFKFNSRGYVETQIWFNRLGHYHSIYEFTRDNNNKVLTKTFHYLDSLGNKIEDPLIEKWIYLYANDRLSKIKKLGDNLTEEPDDKSQYTAYTYDKKGRIIEETRYTYYDFTKPSSYQTEIRYNDTTSTSIAITKDANVIIWKTRSRYNAEQKPLNIKMYQSKNNKLIEGTIISYNTDGQVVTYEVSAPGMTSECPENGTYDDKYSYSSTKLIAAIRHHYKNAICELKFVYR